MKRRGPGSWLIPGGLTGGWKYAALWARTQIRADQKVWKSGQGYTPENWNPGKLEVVKSVTGKGDFQATSQHTGMSSSAGGVRRNPMPLRRAKTTGNHRIVAVVATLPRTKKVASGLCVPKGRRRVTLIPDTGQQYIENRG